ncbi:MAG: hypothetical protein JJ975_09785 [Bacteroidia bacterium]|nr:hypothetical protein [Bacteroidia bacterium]
MDSDDLVDFLMYGCALAGAIGLGALGWNFIAYIGAAIGAYIGGLIGAFLGVKIASVLGERFTGIVVLVFLIITTGMLIWFFDFIWR